MYYSETVKKALNLAYTAHAKQMGKDGYPYIFHPYHLAEAFYDEDSVVTALLHDVVEDTDVTFEDLKREGFSPKVLTALRLLTHRSGVPYLEYVEKIKDDPLARRVKIADLRHNCDTTRGGENEYLRKKRHDCYYPALKMLKEAEGNLPSGQEAVEMLLTDGTILIRDERLWDNAVCRGLETCLQEAGYARQDGPHADGTMCVCPTTKTYSYGTCDGSIRPFGGKAISFDEFMAIFRIYR